VVLRRRGAIAVAGIVAVSAMARLLAARSFAAPWIAPDEMIYGLSGRAFWATGHATVLGGPAPVYGGYPLFVGLPLHLLGTAAGVTAIQCAQALLMSLTAAVVWAWARPLAGEAWALAAAALTTCLPALAYSGLLMSEAAFLPAGTLAVWLAARAIAEPSLARQLALTGAVALATAARLQGLVLIPVVVSAALLAAWFGRDVRLLRRLAPTWILLAAAAAAWTLGNLVVHGSLTDGLGAYSVTVSGGYDTAEAARWVFRHAGDVFLVVLGVPLVATAVLAYESARGRERDAAVRALAAVTVSTVAWVTLQVGTFASRYVGQLAERDLVVAAPPLFACLAVWLARGLPRPQPATSVIAFAVAIPALLLPVKELVTPRAAPDAFMTVPLARVLGATSAGLMETAWVIAVALLVAAAVFVPARAAVVIPVVIGLGLAGSSVLSSAEVATLTQTDRKRFFGPVSRTWVDDAAAGPVTYVSSGGPYWNKIWSTAFWNQRIERVVHFPLAAPESVPATEVRPDASGRLTDPSHRLLRAGYVLAPTSIAFHGEPVATVPLTDIDEAGLRLWRTAGVPRVSSVTVGLKPNGDIVQPVRVLVFDCSRGRLELTLLGKQGTPVEIRRNRRPVAHLTPAPGSVWNGFVEAPPEDADARFCTFEITSTGLVGSTRIEFVR
jgi:hypothetical protein